MFLPEVATRQSGTERALSTGTHTDYWLMNALTESATTVQPRISRSVSLATAAELLGVSRRTIYNRIRDGRLQTIRTLGGSQRVLLDSVPTRYVRPQLLDERGPIESR